MDRPVALPTLTGLRDAHPQAAFSSSSWVASRNQSSLTLLAQHGPLITLVLSLSPEPLLSWTRCFPVNMQVRQPFVNELLLSAKRRRAPICLHCQPGAAITQQHNSGEDEHCPVTDGDKTYSLRPELTQQCVSLCVAVCVFKKES